MAARRIERLVTRQSVSKSGPLRPMVERFDAALRILRLDEYTACHSRTEARRVTVSVPIHLKASNLGVHASYLMTRTTIGRPASAP